ncbi:hypothetical protein OAU81_00755 [bacterium]|nr:hypothetical protein [bacterium]
MQSMIDYLYGSKSIGVRNYTHELNQHMSSIDVDTRLCGVGGRRMLQCLDQDEIQEHLMKCLPTNISNVLHVQYDTLMFRGTGDQMDEMDNMCWFIEQMLNKYERVFITFHGRIEFEHVSWIKRPVDRMLITMLSRAWHKQVIPMLNKCTVLVHSLPHVKLLESQGCNTVQLFTHPTTRHSPSHEPNMSRVRVAIPGQLVDRKRVGQAIETCTHIPNSVLTIDSTDLALVEHYKSIAQSRDVPVELIKWSMNTHEYLDQLSEHDVALVMYDQDVALSGSVIDALRCGLLVGTSSTPSFDWFAEQYQCVTTHANHHMLGDMLTSQLELPLSRARNEWHADNYINLSHESMQQLLVDYNGEQAVDPAGGTHDPLARAITPISRQTKAMPEHMTNISECEEIKSVQGVSHVEYQFKNKSTELKNNFSGLLHGPFVSNETTLDMPSVDDIISKRVLDSCVQLYVTNSKLKELVEPHVNCVVELLKADTFPPVKQFDIEQLLSSDNRCIVHTGWWCKKFESIDVLKLSKNWIKLIHMKFDCPSLELMDMNGVTHESTRVCDTIPDNCVYFVDQATDDVVDEQMLHCIRSNTPILINRNTTTEEYLGDDYVLLFDDIGEAGDLLTDDNIKLAHEQLKRI